MIVIFLRLVILKEKNNFKLTPNKILLIFKVFFFKYFVEMTTQQKQISEQIRYLQERINASKPKPVTSEEINAKIKDLQEQLFRPSEINWLIITLQKQLNSYEEISSRSKDIDEIIKSLGESKEEYLQKIIDEEQNIIRFLMDEQIKHFKRRDELWEMLQLIRVNKED